MAVLGTSLLVGEKTLISLLDIGTTAEVAGRGGRGGGWSEKKAERQGGEPARRE